MKHAGLNGTGITDSAHATMSLPMHGIRALFNAGWIGVDLFFVLSGFLITGILLDTAGRVHYYRNFIVRRALRIFPVYYAFLLVCCVLSASLVRGNVLWYAIYTGNIWMFLKNAWPPLAAFAPLWSLQVEEQFYLTFPWIVLKTTRGNLKRLLIAAVILALVFRTTLALALPRNEIGAYVLMPSRMDGFALGGLIALALLEAPEILKSRLIPFITVAFAIVFAAMWESRNETLIRTVSYTAMDIAFAGVLVLLITGAFAPLTALCRLKPLIHFGAISYSLYILQLPAFLFVNHWSRWFLHLPAGDFLETLAGCAVAIAMAELSWRHFESPFLKLKDQFTVRRSSSSLRASLPASPACP